MKEQELVKQILEYLTYRPGKYWRMNTGAIKIDKRFFKFGVKGMSDIIGILSDGRFFACECKVGKNKLSKDQQEFLAMVWKLGGVGLTAYSLQDVRGMI